MEQTYNNNTTIKYNPATLSEIEVHKCPRLSCTDFFFSYEDLASHKALAHGQIPKFLMEQTQKSTYFSKNQIGRLQRLGSKTSISKQRKILGLFLQDGFEERESQIHSMWARLIGFFRGREKWQMRS